MKIYQINIILLIYFSMIFSCKSIDSENNQGLINENYTKLSPILSYTKDDNDSVIFRLNNVFYNKVKVSLNSKGLLELDSILIKDSKQYFYCQEYSDGPFMFYQFISDYSRYMLICFDTVSKKIFGLDSLMEYDYWGVLIDKNKREIYTSIIGFGKDPGPLYLTKWKIQNKFMIIGEIIIEGEKKKKLFNELKNEPIFLSKYWDNQIQIFDYLLKK